MGHELAHLFEFDHLPAELQGISKSFADIASKVMYQNPYIQNSALQYELLWKLWEAKNLAVVAYARYAD